MQSHQGRAVSGAVLRHAALAAALLALLIAPDAYGRLASAADAPPAGAPAPPPAGDTAHHPVDTADADAARALLDLTWIGGAPDHDFHRPGRWELLGKVHTSMQAGDYPAALESFKREVLEKLCSDQATGLSTLDPFTAYQQLWKWMHPLIPPDDAGKAALREQADALCAGELIHDGKHVPIGEPGAVDWKALVAMHGLNPAWLDFFNPLLAAYILTAQPRYLARWAAYADDWAEHDDQDFAAISAADIPDGWSGASEHMLLFFCFLKGVAMIPGGIDAMPNGTFARVMHRLILDYLPVGVVYLRGNPQNWTEPSIPTLYQLGLILDEYRCAPWLTREARRRLELLTPTRQLPDGSDLDTTVGYSGLYLMSAGPLMSEIQARRRVPDWMLPSWEREAWRSEAVFPFDQWQTDIRSHMAVRARFWIGHCQANGEWPIGGTRNDHSLRAREVAELVLQTLPEAYADHDMASLLSLANGPMQVPPDFLSDYLPYTGFCYLRSGWKPEDPYVFMHCAPQPSNGALSVTNNNAIGMGGYGSDLIETGENGTYDHPRTPVRVDGQQQDFLIGITSWGHRHAMGILPNTTLAPWRFHTSANFDLTEGVYHGPYGSEGHAISGVTHQRLVMQVRAAGVWIVVDRLSSELEHAYDLDWFFPISPGRDKTFEPEQILIDDKAGTITTTRPEGGNVSLWHFASRPLAFTSVQQRTPPNNGYRLHDFVRVSGAWQAAGSHAVVTLIYPRAPHAAAALTVAALPAGSLGFSATLPTGEQVSFQTADALPGALAVAGATATGEGLLVVEDAEHHKSGLVLGASAFALDGHPVNLDKATDAEFSAPGATTTCSPILGPIAVVAIAPGRDAFLGSQEITLSCPTQGVDIRYTTDGSQPGPDSALYQGPFTISMDTIITARALRHGVTHVPGDLSCRQASLPTVARFRSLMLHGAVTAQSLPGLHVRACLGRWQDVLMVPYEQPTAEEGRVPELFARAAGPWPKPVALTYQGFLTVPADGLYTFTAPPESYLPSIFCGYELRVEVAGEQWYPATSRHALGTWSIALAKGKHPFTVFYADMRGDAAARLNTPGLTPRVWPGTVPQLLLEGPGLGPAPIPAGMLESAP